MKLFARILPLIVAAAGFTAAAEPPPPGLEAVRGVVSSFDGKRIVVQTRSKGARTIELAPEWQTQVVRPIAVTEIREGSFIGTTEMPQEDGTGRSLEVHVFPPGVKMGEGHYAWTLRKGSMMTNGTVGKVTASPKGRELEVSYSTGVRHVVVPANVPVVQMGAGDRSLVKVGAPVFVMAMPKPGGGLVANAVAVGAGGAKPPM